MWPQEEASLLKGSNSEHRRMDSMPFIRIRLVFGAMLVVLFADAATYAQSSDSKSRAREILDQARNALGGDAALKSIQSLSAFGDFRSGTGSSQVSGNVQLDLLLPDKLMRTMKWSPVGEMKVTSVEATDGSRVWTDSKEKNSSPILGNETAGIGRGGRSGGIGRGGGRRSAGGGAGSGGSTGSGAGKGIKMPAPTLRDASDANQIAWDFSCMIVGLLLHPPASSQVEISSENNDAIDGVTADYLKIDVGDGSVIRLAIDQKTHRPVMAAYMIEAAGEEKDKAATSSIPEMTKIQIYFSEYKPVAEKKHGNLWLPHQITKTRDGLTVEDMHIKKFELNPHLKPKQFEQKTS